MFGNKAVLDKSKQTEGLENKVIQESISLYLHNKLWIRTVIFILK